MWYLAKRSFSMILILAILSVALFGLLSSMPGNPIDLLITSNPNVKPEDVIRLKRLRGLDQPWYVQYTRWLIGYPEPARPPVILPLPAIALASPSSSSAELDMSDYLADPNFIPTSEMLRQFLTQIWPEWLSSKYGKAIEAALAKEDVSEVLFLTASFDVAKQNEMMRLIEKASAKTLVVEGIFGSYAQNMILKNHAIDHAHPYLWFVVKNNYGQERLGKVLVTGSDTATKDLIEPIPTLQVEKEDQIFEADLKKYVYSKDNARFFLAEGSIGELSADGVYRHRFTDSGLSVIRAQVHVDNQVQDFAFDIEHGVVGHNQKYNRGFLYFFAGDRLALGFSQTYKRPVYDLLFGTPPICGDGKITSGETCDDGNLEANDGCSATCFSETDSNLTKADAWISGYIVRSGRIGNTIQLMFPALLLSLLIAIPLGIFSAYRQYSILDYFINFLAFIGISLPVFWFGIMMIFVFAEYLQFFPAGGVQTPGIYGQGVNAIILDRLHHAILPTIVLSIFFAGRWLRYMRASMLEVLPKDYIRTARAKGLSERVVILKHAFRNALIPVVTVLAISIPSLFGGAVLTETVFSWPGVGRLQYDAVMNSDYYVAIIVFLVSAILVMLGNLLADAIYVLVDPRIRKK